MFVSLIILLLPLNFLAIKLIALYKRSRYTFLISNTFRTAVCIVAPILLIFIFFRSDVIYVITRGMRTYWCLACLILIPASILFYSAFRLPPSIFLLSPVLTHRFKSGLVWLLITIILLSVIPVRLQSIVLVNDQLRWTYHFEPFFYSVSQVVAGKTLLADLPALYGLYAEIMKPIFYLVGLSVFSFTAVMVFLQIISLLTVLKLCSLLIKNNLLRLFCVVSICIVVGGTWALRPELSGSGSANVSSFYIFDIVKGFESYYQYWPLRFMFPTFSVLAFYIMIKHGQSYRAIALMALLSGIAIVWNLDSGIPVFGAFIAFLILQIVFPVDDNRFNVVKKMLLAIIIVLAWLICFGLYLQLKAENVVHWHDLIKYQQLFYQAGYYMLPMPTTLHPWVAVLGVYVFSITGALSRRMQKKKSPTWDVLFFMSILGLGLFSYYQGRSHPIVLTSVLWPAMLIAFILTDRTLRAVQVKILPVVFAGTLIPVLLLSVILTAVYIDSIPIFMSAILKNGNAMLQANKTPVTENIAFIRHHTEHAKSAVIIS